MLLSCHVPTFEWIYTLQLPLCQGTPCPKQAQYLKGGGGWALILKYLDSPETEVFPHHGLYLLILAIFREKWVVKVGPKVQTLSPSSFHGNSNLSIFLQTTLLFAIVLPLMRISAILDYIWGSHPKRAISWMLNRHENFENV